MKIILAGCVQNKRKLPVLIPKLGLGYIATALRSAGHEVQYLDCAKEGMDIDKFKEHLKIQKPGVLGIQVLSCDFSSAERMSYASKEALPQCKVIMGGPHISATAEKTLETFKSADFAFHGEAEIGITKLMDAMEKKETRLESIPGLIYRHEEGIRVNKASFISDIDSLGFPSWDLLKPETYPLTPHGSFSKQTPVAPIITTRGCPYSCTYCSVKFNTGHTLRKRSVPHLMEEIRLLRKEHGIREIHIEDDNFTLNKNFVEEFCASLMKEHPGISWALPNGIRLDTLDKELLKLMEKSGCYSLAVAVESGSQRILSDMKRAVTIEKMIEKIKLISSSTAMKITGFFILGYPTETLEDIEASIDFAMKTPLDKAQFGFFMPLPGTEIYQTLISQGKFDPEKFCWDACVNNTVQLCPGGITAEELRSYRKKAFWKFYSRPKIFLPILKEIRLKNLPYIFKRIMDSFF